MSLSHRPTIAVIGAGAVGSTVAYALTITNLASEVMLIDINEAKEEGEVMDISDAMCFVDTGCVRGADFQDAKAADIIIITAGVHQQPGDTRLDLLTKNAAIVRSVFKQMGKLKKTAIVIMISNPVDVLAMLAQKLSGLPQSQVFGSGTTLDTARMRKHLGEHLHVSPQSISGYVIGEHGNSQLIAWSSVSAGGIRAEHIKSLSAKDRKTIESQVRMGAYDIIERKGATFYGIGMTVTDIVSAIVHDQHRVLPVSARVTKWNGVSDMCIGAPAVIGKSGIESHWPIQLTPAEKKAFQASAATLRTYCKTV